MKASEACKLMELNSADNKAYNRIVNYIKTMATYGSSELVLINHSDFWWGESTYNDTNPNVLKRLEKDGYKIECGRKDVDIKDQDERSEKKVRKVPGLIWHQEVSYWVHTPRTYRTVNAEYVKISWCCDE